MTRSAQRPLFAAIAVALALATVAPLAQAQNATPSMREQRAKRQAELNRGKQESSPAQQAPAQLYPSASRVSPEAKASPKTVKHLQALQDLYEKQDMVGVMAKADEIGAMEAMGAYEKSFAYSLAGNAAADQDQQDRAADYFRKALDANGLDNNSHYNTMFNLAVIRFGEEKYADALETIDRFLAETKSEDAKHLGFRAALLSSLERNEEAAAIYKDLVAKNPDDKRLLMNAVANLQAADKFDEANVLLEEAYKRGQLSEAREVRALYVGYINSSRFDDAQRVMEEAEAKGILEPGPELARDYQVLAQNAYIDDKIPQAIKLYQKAAPMAADGEAYLNLAKVLDYAGKKADAKAAAQKALEKGVKKPEDAKIILSR